MPGNSRGALGAPLIKETRALIKGTLDTDCPGASRGVCKGNPRVHKGNPWRKLSRSAPRAGNQGDYTYRLECHVSRQTRVVTAGGRGRGHVELECIK